MIKSRFLPLAFLPLCHELQSATIIFDLNGVLLKTKGRKASKRIGRRFFISYALSLFKSPRNTQETLMDFLHSIKPRHPDTPAARHGKKLLPQIMCDWFAGTYSCQHMRNIIHAHLNNGSYVFKTPIEKRLVQAIAEFMFTPNKLAESVKPIKKGVELVKACCAQRDKKGNQTHRLFVISNWDPESFEILEKRKKIRRVLNFFDDIIISGRTRTIKPGPRIYRELFAKHNINPNKELCILIDDQQENIDAFNQCGTLCKGILRDEFKNVRKQLQTLQVI